VAEQAVDRIAKLDLDKVGGGGGWDDADVGKRSRFAEGILSVDSDPFGFEITGRSMFKLAKLAAELL